MRRDVFQAIADPTRRAIIALIALQAMTPNALATHFDTSRQAVSKHLRILTECELVKQEHQGREIYYQLEIDKMKDIDTWLEQFRQIWEGRFKQLDNLLITLKDKKKLISTSNSTLLPTRKGIHSPSCVNFWPIGNWCGTATPKVRYLTSGLHPNHLLPKQNPWTLAREAIGTMPW